MLFRSIYVLLVPVMLTFAALACTGAHMQIHDPPVYVCPTSIPRPTDTMPPPDAVGPGTPEPTPRPTHTPYPTPTPYVIAPPQDFYAGDAVFAGGWASDVSVRFRLDNVATHPASPDADGSPRRIVTWTLAVKNVGNEVYEFFPAAQVYVSRVDTGYAVEAGVWGAGQAAADAVGLAFEYAAYSLNAGESVTVALAAYIPEGTPAQFTYLLDPTQTSHPNTITWIPDANPHCHGDILDPGAGGVLPPDNNNNWAG